MEQHVQELKEQIGTIYGGQTPMLVSEGFRSGAKFIISSLRTNMS